MNNFILLTHEREFSKPTNTGQLVEKALGRNRCRRICWQRKEPDQSLLALIEENQVLLLFPQGQGAQIPWQASIVSKFNVILLLDGTWQQARKMYRQSPYLHHLPWTCLEEKRESIFTLRRNQLEGGLCTAEMVVATLELVGAQEMALALNRDFEIFLENYKKGRL